MGDQSRIPYCLEQLFSYRLRFTLPPEVIGPVPGGLRVNFAFEGGEFSGPRVQGRIRPVGGDRLIVRTDGVALLDMQGTFETDDGVLIHAAFPAIMDLGPDGHATLMRGELAADGTPFRSVPRYETAHPEYAWLNRVQCLGIGQVYPSRGEALCDVYAVR